MKLEDRSINTDVADFISDANEIAIGIAKIKNDQYQQRKAKHENFNFFSAIVSGKSSKDHIEKYHSNFIAYLLDPSGSHDFDGAFQKIFLKQVQMDIPENLTFTVKREKETTDGRFIDIYLEAGEWVVFIENKIWSAEGTNQMSDYYKFAKTKANNVLGIYLTPNGDYPPSIDQSENSKVISFSYARIKSWLELCKKKANEFQNVTGALTQYIKIINNFLKIMNEDTIEMVKVLKSNNQMAQKLIENRLALNEAIDGLVKEVRDKFMNDLISKVRNGLVKDTKDVLKDRPQALIIQDGLKIEFYQDYYLEQPSGVDAWGLGFKILDSDDKPFTYDQQDIKPQDKNLYPQDYIIGGGHGGAGNGIYIADINAHSDIDRGNAKLIEARDDEKQWNKIVEGASKIIINEIQNFVIPKFESQVK